MNIIIIGVIALSLIITAIAASLKAKKNHTDKVLAKHGLSEHKARQQLRAKEQANNQALFTQQ